MTAREKLIEKYEDMMYSFGEFDVWQDDIQPKLKDKTTAQIKKEYQLDLEWYTEREEAMG